MHPTLPFQLLAIAIAFVLVIAALVLHLRAVRTRLPAPRRPWWEGSRPDDVILDVDDPPLLSRRSDASRYPELRTHHPVSPPSDWDSLKSARRVFNPGRWP